MRFNKTHNLYLAAKNRVEIHSRKFESVEWSTRIDGSYIHYGAFSSQEVR